VAEHFGGLAGADLPPPLANWLASGSSTLAHRTGDRKHLENIYAKLGVTSRTAAATRFLGLLDEASDRVGEPF
jgi:hypothetical protein